MIDHIESFPKAKEHYSVCGAVGSVILFQECTILIRVEFGMVPNCLSSILANIAGFKCCSTTNSSATFDNTRVNEIGRKWSFIFVICFFLGMDIMSAFFQGGGT